MNDLAVRHDTSPILSAPATVDVDRPMRLVEWAEEARAAHSLAQSLCQTPFAGQYKNDPLAATAAILKGAEVGLTPVTSLGAFDLIQGTPAPKAITLRALVQAHGHSVWIEHSNDSECLAKARRRGESVTHESRWTIGRAQKLGLTSKQNWKNQPAAMLMARATSEVCRMVAADVILGIGYSAEEVGDSDPTPTTTVSRSETKPRSVQRKKPEPVEAPEPELDPEPEPSLPVEEMVTTPQMRKMQAMFSEKGFRDRDDRMAYVNEVVGIEVASSKDLTKDQASRVIDALDQLADVEPEQ